MKRSLFAGLGAAVALTLAVPMAAEARSTPTERPTLAAIVLADSQHDDAQGFDHNPNDFDIVTQAVLLFPDLVAAASDPASNLTSSYRRTVRSVHSSSL